MYARHLSWYNSPPWGGVFELYNNSVHGAEELARTNSSPAQVAGQVVGKS